MNLQAKIVLDDPDASNFPIGAQASLLPFRRLRAKPDKKVCR